MGFERAIAVSQKHIERDNIPSITASNGNEVKLSISVEIAESHNSVGSRRVGCGRWSKGTIAIIGGKGDEGHRKRDIRTQANS